MSTETNTHHKNNPENPSVESLRLPQNVIVHDLPESAGRIFNDLNLPHGYALMGVSDTLNQMADLLTYETDHEFRGMAKERLDNLTNENVPLGDILFAIGRESYKQYEQYHHITQTYGGVGRKYTDESKY